MGHSAAARGHRRRDLLLGILDRQGVACIPGSSFYSTPGAGTQEVRFCYAKKDDTLHEAGRRLRRLTVGATGRA